MDEMAYVTLSITYLSLNVLLTYLHSWGGVKLSTIAVPGHSRLREAMYSDREPGS